MRSVFEFINLFSNSVKNEADSVILFQQNKITSMSMNAQQKKNLFQGSFIWWSFTYELKLSVSQIHIQHIFEPTSKPAVFLKTI